MHQFGLSALGVAPAGLHAARLERLEVAARRNLAVRILRRQPDLDVVSFRRGGAEIAGAQGHHAVVQSEPPENLLRMVRQRLERRVALLRARIPDELHLVELVQADQAAGVAPVATGFAAEAGGVGGEFHRQLVFSEQGVTLEIGDWHLSGGGEEQ